MRLCVACFFFSDVEGHSCLLCTGSLFPWHHIQSFCSPFNQVPEVISRIRQVSKSAFKEDAKSKQDADEAFYNSQKFEVLYCGKVETKSSPRLCSYHCPD